MKKNYGIMFVLVWMFLHPSVVLIGTENDSLRISAEKFVHQICEKNFDAILHSYPMTEEFRAVPLNEDTVKRWTADIDRQFGRLGDIVDRELIEHDQNLRSVYLYYHGHKRPAKIWVTFSGQNIDGLHWDIWIEGYGGTYLAKNYHPLLICLFVVCSIVFTCICIYVGEPLRRKHIKKLRDVYLYQNEHLQACYTEFQNPAWAQIVGHGWALSFVMLTFVIAWTGGGTPFIALVIQVAVLVFAAVFLEIMPLLLLGFFIEVTDQYLIVRMGTFRIQVLRLELQSIRSVETVEFRPIRDLGGWEMRMTSNGWAYFLSGTEGVQVITNTGKKYMIGSDIPDRLEKVIQKKINAINSHD